MGNTGSSGSASGRRRNSFGHHHHHHHHHPPPPYGASPQPQPQQMPPPPPAEVTTNRYVFAAATPYPAQYPNPNPLPYYQYGYYSSPPPAIPVPLPAAHFDHHHHRGGAEYPAHQPAWLVAGRYPPYAPPTPPVPAPYVEHQKAITIKNDVNIKKETLRMEPDEQNPGHFLVSFTFDATVAGSITVFFFAKEGLNCNLTATKEDLLKPVKVTFKEGLGQKFKQPSGAGIDFSIFDEVEFIKEGDSDVYPLAVKAEGSPSTDQDSEGVNQKVGASNSQITQAVFEKKDNGEYRLRVVKQILWVSGTRYELQEIYGIGNSADTDVDGNDLAKECVICLSEPRDTTVLPCRHMCMCSECAKVLRFQTDRCPICRQPVERLLEIKVNNRADEHHKENLQQEL